MAQPLRVISLYLQRHLNQRSQLRWMLLAVLLIVWDAAHPNSISGVRQAGQFVIEPFVMSVSGIGDKTRSSFPEFSYFFDQAKKIHRLKADNLILQQWHKFALVLQQENRELKKYFHSQLVNFVPNIRHYSLNSRNQRLSEQLLQFNVEKGQTIDVGSAVVNENGLVGRVVSFDRGWANVMLISNTQSRIPVRVGKGQIEAILNGRGQQRARLEYFEDNRNTPIKVGDEVFSSSYQGLLPAGLNIGKVIRVESENVLVQLGYEPYKLHYIGVIDTTFQLFEDQKAVQNNSLQNSPLDNAHNDKLGQEQ